MNDTYEGWSNREMWAVALWLDNDYKLYVKYQAMVKTYRYQEKSFASALQKSISVKARRAELPGGMYMDFGKLSGLRKVNWLEVANHMLASVYEDDLYNIAASHHVVHSIFCPRTAYKWQPKRT